jgi:hypothetical protein
MPNETTKNRPVWGGHINREKRGRLGNLRANPQGVFIMTQKSKSRKEGVVKRFLRLFPEYRELEKIVADKNGALGLGAAVIRSYREAVESDGNLIKSLNRYIEALEGKAAMQAEQIQELRGHLSGINKSEVQT